MGMTVEEIKEEIRSDLTSKKMTGDSYSESFRDAIANLLIIAEKYQKIERIIDAAELIGEFKKSKSESYWLNLVKGVIENGNDD